MSVYLLVLSREEGNAIPTEFFDDIFPYSLLRPSKLNLGFGGFRTLSGALVPSGEMPAALLPWLLVGNVGNGSL